MFRHLPPLLGVFVIVLLTATVGAGRMSSAETRPASTTVTLTFDDGVADVYQSGALLSAHGMHGTYFVSSGAIGANGYLTRDQLSALAADGHEIGGHTVTHANLASLPTTEARRQVCNDRSTLLGWGFAVTSFAYPYSSVLDEDRMIAADCGYNSARQVGDIVSPGACDGCDWAETLPPVDPFYTRAPDSAQSTWNLADIEGLITQAQNHGGGWVQITFHHLCTGCDIYGVPVETFTAFLDWLQTQVESNQVSVLPVNRVVTGTVKPAVAGPPPPEPAAPGVNGLVNPGLETTGVSGSTPACWQQAGYGTNTATWAVVSDAHTGSAAERITMTSRTSGDRKLLSTMDLGTCSTSVTPSSSYRASVWYKSTVPTTPTAYYRNQLGGWSYLGGSSTLAASPTWIQASWDLPALPGGATAVSFGLALAGVGTLTTDDYALTEVTPVSETTAPTVTLTEPVEGATATGVTTLAATAADPTGVARVDFSVDGVVVATTTTAPHRSVWSSESVANGSHTVTAVAYDAAGNASSPAAATVTTSNTTRNLVTNSGVETATTTMPSCFQLSRTGTNTGSGARTATAHTGNGGYQVAITARTSGDRKLITAQDGGTCAPAAVAGHTYQVSVWYTADTDAPFVTYYRNAAGAWTYWQTSPRHPATGTWRRATWSTAPLPAGATAVSFGLALTSVGTLTTDDYALTDLG